MESVCIGQHSVCMVRAASLTAAGVPIVGGSSGVITAGIVSGSADMETYSADFGTELTVTGVLAYEVNPTIRYSGAGLEVELAIFDYDALPILAGGTTILGLSGPLSGEAIGYALPHHAAAQPAPLYLEFITRAAAGAGGCPDPGESIAYVGHIFPFTRLAVRSRRFENEAATLQMTGRSISNAALSLGPWGDWPGTGTIPRSAYIQAGYTQDDYDAIADLAACGRVATTGSGS
jgi:hypothetical protein